MPVTTKSPSIFNVPNILTMMRIAAIPLMVYLLFTGEREPSFWAAALFSAASFTDWLDGFLARKMGIVTVFGKFLDPIADKLVVMAALIMIIPLGRVPAWMVLVILGREIIITGLRGIASSEGIVIEASDLGKFKTIFQITAIIALLLHYDYHWFFSSDHPLLLANMHNVGMFYLWIAFFITVWSGADYLFRFVKIITR
jgi:CDP-diacylglycerol--glycerol-3-phosphate 3-phosphatidyltransferase